MKMHKKLKKTIKIIGITVVGLIIISGISIYLLLHNYIHKMNLVEIGKAAPNSIQQELSENDNPSVLEPEKTAEVPTVSPNVSEVMQSLQDQLSQVPEQMQQSPPEQISPSDQTEPDTPIVQSQQSGQVGESSGNGINPSEQPEPEKTVELMEDKQVMNLLLIGSDARSKESYDYSDSIVLFTVNRKTKKLIATTLLNNIYLSIPGHGKDRLVNAFQIGGAALLSDTLEQNFGIKLYGYVMADYVTFFDIVDTIGGVTMEVTKEDLEPVNRNIREINKQIGAEADSDLLTAEGTVVFNGKQALGYSRNWFTESGKFIRIGKQKEIILSIYDKVKKFNFIELNGFLNAVLPHITTNLSENEILELLFMLPVYFDYGLENLSIPIKDTEKRLKKEGKTILDIDMEKNRSELYRRLFNIE